MLCTKCGNEVKDPARCPVCAAGRGGARKMDRKRGSSPHGLCPRCDAALGSESWEGSPVFVCPTCRGSFFPGQGLEEALNKLRATCASGDLAGVLAEFKGRFSRSLPSAVRYKGCPQCGTVMTRRNYQTVSGVIVDTCGQHGTWVDESAFAELADFITKGGDILAAEARKVRARLTPHPQSGPSIIDKLFGGK